MCDTPLEVRYMLADTEARARAFASEVRSEDAAMAGGLARLKRLLGRLVKPLGGYNPDGVTKQA
jgi:hypothetical protein